MICFGTIHIYDINMNSFCKWEKHVYFIIASLKVTTKDSCRGFGKSLLLLLIF